MRGLRGAGSLDAACLTGAVAGRMCGRAGFWGGAVCRGGALAALVALAACLVIACLGVAAAPATARADEPAEGDNAVNVQQLPDSSFIYDTSISDLASADSYFDNQTVQVTGEVVGDRITGDADGDHCWVVLAAPDGMSTVSVYLSNSAADKIDTYGGYGKTGTTLQVKGTFHLTCDEHQGVSDMHATAVSVVKPGKVSPDEFDLGSFAPGLALVAVGLVLVGAFYWLRERQR